MSVSRNSFFFAAGTLLSRISGLFRDTVIAWSFGASPLLDCFLLASRIPNLFREMLAEGALSGAFTKVFTDTAKDSQKEALKLLADVWKLVFIFGSVFCTLGILFAPELLALMSLSGAPLLDSAKNYQTTLNLTRLLFPYLALAMLGSVAMGALHQGDRFFLSAVSPIALNLGYILGATGLSALFVQVLPESVDETFADRRILGLAVGMVLGGVVHAYAQTSGIKGSNLSHLFLGSWRSLWNVKTKKVFQLMLPASIAASTGPLNLFINTNFAMLAGPGAVSWLYYAFHILHLPIGIFAVAIGSALLPAMTRALKDSPSAKTPYEAAELFQNAMELLCWLLTPCFVVFFLNAEQIMAILFQRGRFTSADTIASSQALQAYSLSLVPYGLQKIFQSYLYARERTSYAMKVSIFGLFVNAAACSLLVQRFGHVGLALSSSTTVIFSSIAMGLSIFSDSTLRNQIKIRTFIPYILGALVTSLFASKIATILSHNYILNLSLPSTLSHILILAATGCTTVVCFFAFGCLRFKTSPKQLPSKIRTMMRRNTIPQKGTSL